jgi:hypothetical protein
MDTWPLATKWWISKYAPGKSSTRACSMRWPRCRAKPSCRRNTVRLAFADAPIPIGFGQTMLAPKLQGRICRRSASMAATASWKSAAAPAISRPAWSLTRRPPLRSIDTASRSWLISRGGEPARNGPGRTRATSRFAMRSIRHSLSGEFDAIAVTGIAAGLRHDASSRRLRVGGRLFAVVGSGAGHGRACWCAGSSANAMAAREPVRDGGRQASIGAAAAGRSSCSDECKNITAREFVERRARRRPHDAAGCARRVGSASVTRAQRILAHSDGPDSGTQRGDGPRRADRGDVPLRRTKHGSHAIPAALWLCQRFELAGWNCGVVKGCRPHDSSLLNADPDPGCLCVVLHDRWCS